MTVARPRSSLPTLRQLLAGVHMRLILFTVALATASLLLSGMIVIRNYAARNLNLTARTVAYTIEPAVVFKDRAAVLEGIVSVAAVGGVDRVEVREPGGAMLAEWNHPHGDFHSHFEDAAKAVLWPKPAYRQLRRGDAALAEVRVYGNSEGLLRYVLSGAIIALSCLGLTVIATASNRCSSGSGPSNSSASVR